MPFHFEDKIALIGDSAHRILPFYGQGVNCGMESAELLYNLMQSETDLKTAFSKFSSHRKVDTDAIADLTFGNYNNLVTGTLFSTYYTLGYIMFCFAMKGIGLGFIPEAFMVMMSLMPYREVMAKTRFQKMIFSTFLVTVVLMILFLIYWLIRRVI
jgi:kynurenine 3-monooxygenase